MDGYLEKSHYKKNTLLYHIVRYFEPLKCRKSFKKLSHEQSNCRFTKYHTTNKCTNYMSFILNHFFKILFTAPTCFDSISLIIIREYI